MRLKDIKKLVRTDQFDDELEKSPEEIYKEIEEDANNFLKTRKGLSWMLMKYPTLSVAEAIKEEHYMFHIADAYA